jgi:hypothetical protein
VLAQIFRILPNVEQFWGKFLRYRFDVAALAFDCVATFFTHGRPVGRILALLGALLVLGPPIFVLVAGNDRFGDTWAFGLTLALFVVMLEAPGHLWRRRVANGGPDTADGVFDRFLFSLLTLAGASAPFVLLRVNIESARLLGIVWGVAVVGAQDLARSGIASFLALSEGHPVYVR